jgi:hypothetical protein
MIHHVIQKYRELARPSTLSHFVRTGFRKNSNDLCPVCGGDIDRPGKIYTNWPCDCPVWTSGYREVSDADK